MEQGLERWFFVIHRCRHGFFREHFAGLDLEPRFLPFVLLVSGRDGVRQEDLSTDTGLDKTTVAHAVKHLAQSGYVLRERNPADRRSYRLTLTPKGKNLVPRIRAAISTWHAGLLTGFTEDERRTLEEFLSRLAESAAALAGRSDSSTRP